MRIFIIHSTNISAHLAGSMVMMVLACSATEAGVVAVCITEIE